MAKNLRLQVVAPDRPAIDEEISFVILPGELGEFGVLPQHMKFLSILKPGTMQVVKGQQRDLYFVSGGFAEVNPNSVIVLAEAYEKVDEIDVERAHQARKKAEENIAEKKDNVDLISVKASLVRAEARLKVVEKAKSLKK
jgi:F-type H+-transporting ATPase subunit epsilon